MRNLAIIPARGGSKRILKKNIKPFLGKPIIAYSIEAAISSNLFDEVMVSTDDLEIVEVALAYGAKVPFMRSPNTANDYATIADVLREVLEQYNILGQVFDNMCCILATSPLIKTNHLHNAYKKLIQSEDLTSISPIVPFSYPILRGLELNEEGHVNMKWPEYAKTRSQDLATVYHDSGTFYWHKTQPWLSGTLVKGAIIMNEIEVQDIDTETDWQLAELKYRLMDNEKK
ncbi:pseudaminic acid cytidylyltransferase [Bacteroides sp. OttesenSCG-928-D19]|nr:pseudaminic acid cytidylyltransferase [Bacteroides sp. OttesenSCG-928-D19]